MGLFTDSKGGLARRNLLKYFILSVGQRRRTVSASSRSRRILPLCLTFRIRLLSLFIAVVNLPEVTRLLATKYEDYNKQTLKVSKKKKKMVCVCREMQAGRLFQASFGLYLYP